MEGAASATRTNRAATSQPRGLRWCRLVAMRRPSGGVPTDPQRRANGRLTAAHVRLIRPSRALCAGRNPCYNRYMLEFRLLGPLEVVSDEGPIDIAGQRQRALLALLVLRANQVVPSETLVELLWGEQPPRT